MQTLKLRKVLFNLIKLRNYHSWNNNNKKENFFNFSNFLTTFAIVSSSVTIYFQSKRCLGRRYFNYILRNGLMDGHLIENWEEDLLPPERPDLPIFKLDEVKKHGKFASRIWVTYHKGIYDITDFIVLHPGGDKILLAAGSSIEPYWDIYSQHKTSNIIKTLESFRVGSLDSEDLKALNKEIVKKKDFHDPYSLEQKRHPDLIVNSNKPFNAESPPSVLADHFYTPNELFFVRNHMPVPKCNLKTHQLKLNGLEIDKEINLTVNDLKKNYKKVSVTSAIQCAGNRRNDMNNFKEVEGLLWRGTAISNAKWSGCRLRDVLISAGVDPNSKKIKHVHFEGADKDNEGTHYETSIPFEKAISLETIIAYEMNNKNIPQDHGFPLRLICPGIVGARQVKWLTRISTSDKESSSHWQKNDYKSLPLSITSKKLINYDLVPSIQEYPVQSAICVPAPNSSIKISEKKIEVKGYAWSGGGRGIIRVEVTLDNGKTWKLAKLQQDSEQNLSHMWAWTLWKAELEIPQNLKNHTKLHIICKATDSSYNTQPETAAGIWNMRGFLHNAWHHVPIIIIK